MRIMFLTATLLSSLALVNGCDRAPTTKTVGIVEYDVFPTEVIVMKPGESKDVKFTRKGKDLKDTNLTVTSSDPKVKVEGGQFKGSGADAMVTIKVDPDAAAKEHKIMLKSGDVTKTLNIRVDAAGAPGVIPDVKVDQKPAVK